MCLITIYRVDREFPSKKARPGFLWRRRPPGVCEIAGGTGKRPSGRHRSPRQSANGRPRCSAWTILLYGAAEVCRTTRIGVPSIAERRGIKRALNQARGGLGPPKSRCAPSCTARRMPRTAPPTEIDDRPPKSEFASDSLLEETVRSELVSLSEFPGSRELTGNFRPIWCSERGNGPR